MEGPERKLYDAAMEYLKETMPQITSFLSEQTGGGMGDFFSGFFETVGGKRPPATETAKERYETAKGAYGEGMSQHDIGSPMRTNKLLESVASSLLILVERGMR